MSNTNIIIPRDLAEKLVSFLNIDDDCEYGFVLALRKVRDVLELQRGGQVGLETIYWGPIEPGMIVKWTMHVGHIEMRVLSVEVGRDGCAPIVRMQQVNEPAISTTVSEKMFRDRVEVSK